ncbi:hypothetical protein AMJ83_00400 [candidate division WOR_3 bacterium SM23_42]|uniref:Secretion system C-terminal sorting domain-containing protein n=1 Tax=candidate division WOR_3 bacterium SM23_42 TaxID=1703779 RepID=A0A0S8FVJ2_UNCW3|nr:MAG: hypothetical protein AMJ83_00400 [candidate division WOR_3 bacterium SM23_42]
MSQDTLSNVTGILSSTSSDLTINDANGYWGMIAPGESAENVGDPFSVTAGASTPPGTKVDFSLNVTADAYQTDIQFDLQIGTPFLDCATHDCGNVLLSMTRHGAIGYMGSDHSEGVGFYYPPSQGSHLYYGSFAVGTDANYVVDQYYEQNWQDDADWQTTIDPDGRIRMFEPGPEDVDEYSIAIYTDAGHSLPKNLVCSQYSWAWNIPQIEDFVITKFVLRNDGSQTINDLYAAMFMDWNIGSGIQQSQNQGSSDASRNMAYMYYNTPYVGTAILDPPRSTAAANLALIDHAIYVNPYQGLPDDIQIQFMDGTIQNASTDRPFNWSACNSVGPFTLAPGEAYAVAFAVIGGDDLADLEMNADSAYDRYWAWTGIAENRSEVASAKLAVYPVISRDGQYALEYSLANATPASVTLYDILGRVLEKKYFGLMQGTGTIALHLKPLAQGVYFIQVQASNRTETTKIIQLR